MQKNNKRVLILRSNPVDPDPRVEKEADTLLEAGYSVDIFCWDRGSDHAIEYGKIELSNGSCDVYRIGIASSFGSGFKKNLKPLLKFQMQIVRFLRKERTGYDVLHACDFDTALAGYVGSSRKKNHFVYDIFDYYADAFAVPLFLRKVVIALDTYVVDHADAVIICSEKRKEQLGYVRPKQLVVIHNSPSWKLSSCSERNNTERLRIAYIGILSDGRLIPELLDIVSRHEEYELHIAGFGKYEKLAYDYAVTCDNVKFYGRIDYSQTLTVENESDVMIAAYDPTVANHKYAAPNKFYEALMLGKPLIMCKGTGFSDIVDENEIGICIEYSSDALENGLAEIRDEQKKYTDKSAFEKELFNREYSWDIMSDRLCKLYQYLS